MLDRDRHNAVMAMILKDVYAHTTISPLLGFKGGTAAHFFYDLPRFSVDLDFDLLDNSEENRNAIFYEIKEILLRHGEVKDEQQKYHTIFFLLSYGTGQRNIKVEINTRKTGASYKMKNYLGIPMLVSLKESMFAAKLVALTKRKSFTARDLYDVHYFLTKHWDIDESVLAAHNMPSLKKYLKECSRFVEKIPNDKLLAGLGEFITEEEKRFIRENLKKDTVFLLKLRAQ